jgi:Protein of unknown function with HXXEE motif
MAAETGLETRAAWERGHFYSRLLWVFPLVYLAHILEESRGFPDWVNGVLQGRFSSVAFCLANSWFMVVLLALTRLAAHRKTRLVTAVLFFWLSGQVFWDAVFHIYTENHFSTYSPGFFTAAFLYVPLYAFFVYLALREGFLSVRAWLLGLVAGALVLGLVIWAGLYRFSPIPWSLYG